MRRGLPIRPWLRVVAGFVALVVAGTALSVALAAQRASTDQRDREADERVAADELIERIDRSLGERIAQLDVAVSFVESAWPLDPKTYEDFLASYRLGTKVANLSLGIVVEAVPTDRLAEVETRERAHTPDFAIKTFPATERPDRMILMRLPMGSSRADRNLMGLDISSILPGMGLPEAKLEDSELWLHPIGGAAELIKQLVGPENVTDDVGNFATVDLLGVQRMQTRDGTLIGWFIVPVRTSELLDSASDAAYAVEVELLDASGATQLHAGDAPNANPPILAKTIASQNTSWRVTVRRAEGTPPPERLDRHVLLRGVLSTFAISTLVLAIFVVHRRERGLRFELDRTTRLATTDYLTGVLNREGLERTLATALADPADPQLYVFLFDVDRFKLVNDTEGHQVGDRVLQEVALRMRSVIGGRGALARFGGDEFVIVTTGLRDVDEAEALADQLHREFDRPLVIDGGEFLVSVSVGISAAGESRLGITPTTLLRDADVAMYAAKRHPTLRTAVFDEAMRDQALRTIEIERELRVALRRGEIVPHFQPLFGASDQLIAFEALARWEHPQRGLLRPAEFLDVAAEAGCLVELNRQILRRSCEQGMEWLNLFPSNPICMLVNLAEELLLAPAFHEEVAAILRDTGFPAGHLTLEINEDTVLSRLSPSLVELRALSDLGVKLAIDDFGRGRSSLLALSDLDMVTVLKLDRAFVSKLPTHKPTRTVFLAVQEIAHAFGMVLVGEGVETESEAAELRALGVDCLQGYLLGRPMPAAAATERLAVAANSVVGDAQRGVSLGGNR